MVPIRETTTLRLWKFIRGDEPTHAFERWVYQDKELEAELGGDLYLEVISTDFRDPEGAEGLRKRLGSFARSLPGPACLCIRLRDLDIVDMGFFPAPAPAFEQDREWSHEDVFRTLERVHVRGDPWWWLWAARCSSCGQAWLVGQEERHNDIFCLRRMEEGELRAIEADSRWPRDFDSYERLLQLGHDAGRSVRFVDPLDSSLRYRVEDLALARPGIKVSEIAELLSLDLALAVELARRVMSTSGVAITLDTSSR
ncbi:MAG: hypothetical protein M3M93_01875 [Actinomycetota bacterium]|nr:hypothetical protein [Actinomycetota bacterium]